VTWPSPRQALGTSALVVQSDLQAVFLEQSGQLMAWVTTTQGQSKAMEGARVQVYASVYGKVRMGLHMILCMKFSGSHMSATVAAEVRMRKYS
jgi:hypothetical protein